MMVAHLICLLPLGLGLSSQQRLIQEDTIPGTVDPVAVEHMNRPLRIPTTNPQNRSPQAKLQAAMGLEKPMRTKLLMTSNNSTRIQVTDHIALIGDRLCVGVGAVKEERTVTDIQIFTDESAVYELSMPLLIVHPKDTTIKLRKHYSRLVSHATTGSQQLLLNETDAESFYAGDCLEMGDGRQHETLCVVGVINGDQEDQPRWQLDSASKYDHTAGSRVVRSTSTTMISQMATGSMPTLTYNAQPQLQLNLHVKFYNDVFAVGDSVIIPELGTFSVNAVEGGLYILTSVEVDANQRTLVNEVMEVQKLRYKDQSIDPMVYKPLRATRQKGGTTSLVQAAAPNATTLSVQSCRGMNPGMYLQLSSPGGGLRKMVRVSLTEACGVGLDASSHHQQLVIQSPVGWGSFFGFPAGSNIDPFPFPKSLIYTPAHHNAQSLYVAHPRLFRVGQNLRIWNAQFSECVHVSEIVGDQLRLYAPLRFSYGALCEVEAVTTVLTTNIGKSCADFPVDQVVEGEGRSISMVVSAQRNNEAASDAMKYTVAGVFNEGQGWVMRIDGQHIEHPYFGEGVVVNAENHSPPISRLSNPATLNTAPHLSYHNPERDMQKQLAEPSALLHELSWPLESLRDTLKHEMQDLMHSPCKRAMQFEQPSGGATLHPGP